MPKKGSLTPPERLERELLQVFPDLDSEVARLLGVKASKPWPDWCYLPIAGSIDIISRGMDTPIARRYLAGTGQVPIRKMSAIIPWRLCRVICRFDPTLTDELTGAGSSPLDAPAALLHGLPWPCVFVADPPGVPGCLGFFAFLEWDARYPSATELRMHYLFDDGDMQSVFLTYADDAAHVYAKMGEDNRRLASEIGGLPKDFKNPSEHFRACLAHVYAHVNMLLYLCSEEPDITRSAPVPRRRGRGPIQTAAYPDMVDVGSYVGSVIRRAAQDRQTQDTSDDAAAGKHSPHRPHVRRAHWHLYWTGAGRTVPRVRWVMPAFIHGHSNTTTVIHTVKPDKEEKHS